MILSDKPAPALVPADDPGLHATLFLVIEGCNYTLERLEPTPAYPNRWRLSKAGSASVYVAEGDARGGVLCDCPGFRYKDAPGRRPGDTCRHVRALRKVGLL